MGLLMSLSAYSATKRSLSLHKSRPMVGLRCGSKAILAQVVRELSARVNPAAERPLVVREPAPAILAQPVPELIRQDEKKARHDKKTAFSIC